MIKTKPKHIKSKKEFEVRLWLDNLMEKVFVDIKKNIVINKGTTGFNDVEEISYTHNDKRRFEYYPETGHLRIYQNFITMFTKIFAISDTRAKSFLKRMIIKHYELDVRVFD